MSVSGISTTTWPILSTNNFQKIQQGFQQLGQDLQSGNLSAAQSDYATLTKLVPKLASDSSQTTGTTSSNPLVQGFAQLSQDLQAGNLTAAQQDYTNIQQAFQHFSPQSGGVHGHHRHHTSGATEGKLATSSEGTGSSQALPSTGTSTISVKA